jgi:predicted anti-sigma-YlaC factor YlaD
VSEPGGHLSERDLADFDESDPRDEARARTHLQGCEVCRRRREELVLVRELLARSAERERRPPRDVVPGVMMRLRLRRHGITNANEFLEGFVAFVRGLASLFSVPKRDVDVGRRAGEDDT